MVLKGSNHLSSTQGTGLITTAEEKETLRRMHETQKEQERAVSTQRKNAMLKVGRVI